MFSTITKNFKPVATTNGKHHVNWVWLLQRAPILALGLDSSYNVAKYIGLDGTPYIMQIVTGITFDVIFVGLIALADQFRTSKLESKILFWTINGIAMCVSAILGTLAYSQGYYHAITLESATRGIAYPLLGLLYNLYYHTVTGEVIMRQQAENEALCKLLNEKPYVCEFCGSRYETVKQRSGHMTRCSKRPAKIQ